MGVESFLPSSSLTTNQSCKVLDELQIDKTLKYIAIKSKSEVAIEDTTPGDEVLSRLRRIFAVAKKFTEPNLRNSVLKRIKHEL